MLSVILFSLATPIFKSTGFEVLVINSAGKPVADAKIGTALAVSASRPEVLLGYEKSNKKTDLSGKLECEKEQFYNRSVVALKDDQVGIAEIKSEVVTVKLRPLRTVNIELSSWSAKFESAALQVVDADRVIGFGSIGKGKSSFQLPQQDLKLAILESLSATVEAKAKRSMTIRLKPTKWASMIGKSVLTSSSTSYFFEGQRVDGSKLKGKWILLDFWATWCAPCVAEFPKMIEFVRKHPEWKDRFGIVAIHSPDGKSYASKLPEINNLVRTKWSDQKPNFILAFDAAGDLVKKLGVETYPSTFLIDPEGKLVGQATLNELLMRLQSSKS
jgi:thiol-disulfide isomerase/thioredoxin